MRPSPNYFGHLFLDLEAEVELKHEHCMLYVTFRYGSFVAASLECRLTADRKHCHLFTDIHDVSRSSER